jgi:hypothetical protein
MNNEILDPWNISNNFSLKYGKNIILGPILDKKNKIRINIEFLYEKIDDNIHYLYTLINETSDFKHLYLKLYKNESIIENISKSNTYSGSEFLLFGLQIIYRIYSNNKNHICKLIDSSFFICNRKNLFKPKSNNIFTIKEEIQLKIILLLKFGSTFYMPFGFNSYDKNNYLINKNDDIINLVTSLWNIEWDHINLYINTMKNIVL